MKLTRVRPDCAAHVNLLYDLLAERKPHESISHKVMPSRAEHCLFVRSNPYRHWYIVSVDRVRIGAVYITQASEVGIAILRDHRRNGYAEQALYKLMRKHPGRLLANVNPGNKASLALFHKFGFTKVRQVTLASA